MSDIIQELTDHFFETDNDTKMLQDAVEEIVSLRQRLERTQAKSLVIIDEYLNMEANSAKLQKNNDDLVAALKSAAFLLSGLEGCSRNNMLNLALEEIDAIEAAILKAGAV